MECADAHKAEPTANKNREPSSIGRRPKISASLPLKGRMEVQASVYAAETQAKESVPRKSCTMTGSAVATDAYIDFSI